MWLARANLLAETVTKTAAPASGQDRPPNAPPARLQCINGGELELLDAMVAPEFVGPNGETGAAGLRGTFAALRVAFPDIHYTLEDLFAEGDRVAVRWTWEGTHTAPIRGFPAHGTRVKDVGMAIYELGGGKIRKVSLQTDRLGLLQQIGVVPDDAGLRAGVAVAGK